MMLLPTTLLTLPALLSPAAQAQEADVASLIVSARAAIKAKDWPAALAALAAAEAAAPKNPALISNPDIARIYFFRGVIEARKAGSLDPAMDWWRRALVIAPDYQPDSDVLPDSESQDVFYALAEETKGRNQVALNLPEDPGDALIFIDGKPREVGDSLFEGRHFVQIRCDTGDLVGAWHTLGTPPPDWLVLCSGGSYPSEEPSGKPPKPTRPPKERPPREDKGGNLGGVALMAGGAALLAGGLGTNFLLVNPAYDDIAAANANPGSVTEAEAQALESQFNTGRFLTIGLVALGAATASSGVVVTVVDWQIRPTLGGVLLSTTW